MDVYQAIQIKRAVRTFSEKQLPKNNVDRILNAGRRAQSAKNIQPWKFIAIENKSILNKLSSLGLYASHLNGAAFAVAIITQHPDNRFSVMFDAGQAAAYMQLAAWELGIGSCLATIYQTDEARQLLKFPDEFHIRVAISFGYPKNSEDLTREPQAGGRIALEEIVHWNTWKSS